MQAHRSDQTTTMLYSSGFKRLAGFVAVPRPFPLVPAGMTGYHYKPRVKMHMNQHPFD